MATAELQVVISGDDRLSGALGSVNKSLKTLGTVALGVGAAGVAAVGAAAGVAAKDFVNFQQGMNEVFTLMPDISGQAMGEMTQQVKDLSTEFGVMPEEVVPALYQSISAGVPRDNVFNFLETAQKAAAGGVTDLTTAVDGISSTVNAYGEDIINAGEASDLMFTAVRLGKTTFEELSGSLANVNPMAASMGVNFADTTAALATMTSQGTSTSVATTQLRGALQELGKQGTEVSGIFQEAAGVSFTDFIAEGGNMVDAMGVLEQASADTGVPIQDMFGSVEAGLAAMQLTGAGADSFAENLAEMEGAAGATDAAFERMNGGLQATFNRIKSTFKVALLDFAEAFSPLLEAVAGLAEDLLPKFQDALENKIMPIVERVTGVIVRLFENMGMGMNPINAISGALSGLFGADVAGKFVDIALAVQGFIAKAREVLTPIVQAIGRFVEWKDVLLALGIAVGIAIAALVGPLVVAAAKIGLIFAGLVAVIAILRNAWENNWGGIRDILTSVWQGTIQPALQSLVAWLQVKIPLAIQAVKQFWETTLKPALQQTATFIKTVVVPAITDLYNWLKTNIPIAIQAVKTFWETTLKPALQQVQTFITGTVVPAISKLVTWLRDTLTAAFSNVQAFWVSTLQPALSALWSFINEDVVPVVQSFIDVVTELAEIAFTAVQGAWENILKPALDALWGVIQDNVVPAVEDGMDVLGEIAGFIEDTLGPVVNTLVDGALAGLRGAFEGIKRVLGGLKDLFDRFKQSLQGFELPGFLQPGSPSPFENSLRGISDAMMELNSMHLPAFQANVSRTGAAGAASRTTTNNFIMNVNSDADRRNVVGDFRLMQARVGGI